MYNALDGVERLIEDLKKENLLLDASYEKSLVRLMTPKFLLIVYLPHAVRIEHIDEEKVIHLDVDVLNSSYTKVIQRIKGLSGKGIRLYARNTVVARIDKKTALEFLEDYHLNIPIAGKYRYGLYYQGELVSVAIFSGGRIMREISDDYRSFELVRFCHKADYLVTGGISKLVKAFVKDFNPNDIMTYADRDWGQQSSLTSIGFKEEGISSKQWFYIKDGKRINNREVADDFDYCIENLGSIKLKLYL